MFTPPEDDSHQVGNQLHSIMRLQSQLTHTEYSAVAFSKGRTNHVGTSISAYRKVMFYALPTKSMRVTNTVRPKPAPATLLPPPLSLSLVAFSGRTGGLHPIVLSCPVPEILWVTVTVTVTTTCGWTVTAGEVKKKKRRKKRACGCAGETAACSAVAG